MFLDRLIDRLAGQGPVLKPSEALAEELANPIWETSPSDEVPEALDLGEIKPQLQNATGRKVSKTGKPPSSDDEPLVSHDPLVQFEPSEQNAEIPAPVGHRIVGESTPDQNEPPRQPRIQGPKTTEETRPAPTALTASTTEKRLVQTRPYEPEKPDIPAVRIVPSKSEYPDIPERSEPQTRPDPPIPLAQDNAGIEVTVHIGQIETVAPQPAPSAAKSAARNRLPRPILSLQDYIENRRRGMQ